MRYQRLYRILILVQGSYTIVTALWGLLHIRSFMQVTGPKTDIWLVKTVCALLIPIGITLLSDLRFKTYSWPLIILGTLTALGLAAIDFYYTANETIRWVYALDGVAELMFAFGWAIIGWMKMKAEEPRP